MARPYKVGEWIEYSDLSPWERAVIVAVGQSDESMAMLQLLGANRYREVDDAREHGYDAVLLFADGSACAVSFDGIRRPSWIPVQLAVA